MIKNYLRFFPKIKRSFKVITRSRKKFPLKFWMDIILFNLIFYIRKAIGKQKKIESKKNLIGFVGTSFYNANSMQVYKKLSQNPHLKLYWLSHDKKFLENLRKMNINSYYLFDFTKINQFLETNIWIIDYFYSTIRLFYHRVKIVNLWHAIASKGYHHSKYFTDVVNRQTIFTVTSKFFYNYFTNKCKINRKIVQITGFPRTDPLIKQEINGDEIKKQLKLNTNSKIILYAPTHNQEYKGKKYLFPWIEDNGNIQQNTKRFLDELMNYLKEMNAILIIRPHFYWYRHFEQYLKNLRNINEIKILTHKEWADINSLLVISDILITDWSSIANEFLLLDRPILFLDLSYEVYKSYIFKERAGYIIKTKEKFFNALTEIFRGVDRFKTKRKQLLSKLYDHLDGHSTERVINEIQKII